jgi:chemotaxis protein MotA
MTAVPWMSFDRLFDPNALLIVIGGTLAATLLRAGWGEIGNARHGFTRLFRRRFSETRARAALASQAMLINREGLLRAPLAAITDRDLREGVDAMLNRRSIDALIEHHQARRVERERMTGDAARLFSLAADLAPVFGLAGTLVALTQLPTGGLAPAAISGVVSSAVLTTLYGVISANLIYGPIARQIARVGEREEEARQAVIDWLRVQITVPQPVSVLSERATRRHAA